ncbi:MAG: hypothetical protein LBL33_09940 [Tannerella sp.]|jgi:hypothetical protein|nr:hypothetical protein [Tannerella sp.]
MIKEKSKVQVILESVFVSAIDKLIKADAGHLIGFLYVQLDTASGEIQVYDDRETLLEKNIIFDWADQGAVGGSEEEQAEKGAHSYKQQVNSIRAVLAGLKARKIFDNPVFMRPLKVSLVDDDFCEIEQIFVLGSEDSFMEGRLMKNLEQELQNFSKKLFADME